MKVNFLPLNASTLRQKKLRLIDLTVLVQVPPYLGKVQIPHSLGTDDSQMPMVCPGGDVEALN